MAGPVQPEVANYDVGVYQLQLTDPVQGGVGGVSNAPLLNLANRTAWLYQQLNLVIAGTTIPPTVAPLNSPPLTGTPTTPTPPLGDNSSKISNTAWVQSLVSGVLNLSVAGGSNVVLSAVQAGNGTLNLTGALTANIAVILPSTPGKWIVENNTTGAFTLTVKTAAGTGVVVTQGKNQSVYGDATNIYLASNDFSSIQLTGTPTSVTPPVGDQSTKVSTTNFAYQLKNGVVSVPVGGGANVVLTPAQYGNGILLLTGALTAAIEVIVPSQGGTYVIANETTGAFGMTLATSAGSGAKTAVIPQGQSVVAYCDGTNVVLAGAAATSSFAVHSFTATAGQTDFPCSYTPGNIMVIQDGSTLGSANYTATDGANVVLATGAPVGDEIQVIAFSSFTVANAVTVAGAIMVGAMTLAGGDTGVAPAQLDNSSKLVTSGWANGVGACAGSMRNLRASLLAAGTSITFTADEIVVETALGGAPFRIPNFNQTLNGTSTGIGGLDTGALAANSSYAVYAAYNGAGQQAGIFAQLEATTGATTIYSGAHLPAGYTATALISVLMTNGSAQFIPAVQEDRHVTVASVVSNTYTAALTNTSITLSVPYSARSVDIVVEQSTATAASSYIAALSSSTPVAGGFATFTQNLNSTGLTVLETNGRVYPFSPRTVYGTWTVTGGTSPELLIAISGYDF